MKKIIFALVLIIAFTLIGCSVDDGGGGTVLEGTWTHVIREAQEATFKFTGNNFVYTRNDGIYKSGKFQINDNMITLIVDNEIVRRYLFSFHTYNSTISVYFDDTPFIIDEAGDREIYYSGEFVKKIEE